MTKSELLEVIANGENTKVEFKRDCLTNHALAKEIVAFLNTFGGIVILGVEDDGEISGITKSNISDWIVTACRDKIKPEIEVQCEIYHSVKNNKDVAIVRVERGYAVHCLWHNNSRKYFKRVGSQSREANQEELSRLFQQKQYLKAEKQPISGCSISDLDRQRINSFFRNILQIDIPKNDNELFSVLGNIELMTGETINLGCMLLFGKSPNRFLPQARIDAFAFPSEQKDYNFTERKTIHGPMTPLLSTDGEVVENGIVEQALDFVQRNTRTTSKLDGGRRIDQSMYPQEAVRESIVNALIHRDYLLVNSAIELASYNNRLEIISPGKLPNGVTVAGMRLGVRATRNDILTFVMSHYKYMESIGMGVRRKIVEGMRKHNGTEPELIEMEENERFIIRLFAVNN